MFKARRFTIRSGATLTEVLMSLLIMSIGIVSVITMFPLAVLRSIQATQLTNSRLLKQNIQQAVRTQYDFFRPGVPVANDPAFRFDLTNQTTITHAVPAPATTRLQFRGEWQPATTYYVGEVVVPTRKAGGTMPTPNLWFVCQVATGPSGEIEPNWLTGTPIVDGSPTASVTWLANTQNVAFSGLPISARPFQPVLLNGVAYDALNYVIDPLGWQMFATGLALNTPATSANDFGYSSSNSVGGPIAPATAAAYATPQLQLLNHRLLRVNGGLTALATNAAEALSLAEGIGLNGDTWTPEISSPVDSIGPIAPLAGNRSAVFPSTVDLTAIAQAASSQPGSIRVVLKNVSGDVSVVRVLGFDAATPAVDLATNRVRWREPLPPGFVPDGQCRLERIDKRYSWLATVNKDPRGGATTTTVAIIAKRSFTPDDEHVYTTNFTTGLADQAQISWTGGEPTPLLREGNYVLDGYTARWYRIIAVSGSTSPVTVTFDEKIPLNHRVPSGRLIVMRGIVEIFEL